MALATPKTFLAKLTRPRFSKLAPQRRLWRRLDEARRTPATWIVGPPGAGKTTLVASYIEDRSLSCLWYHIDEGDNDIASFFHYLTLLAKTLGRRASELPRYALHPETTIDAFARQFFRTLWPLVGKRVLVLDDYQNVLSPSVLDQVLRIAISELPAHGRVIVASRAAPPTVLARLRTHGQITTIGPPELQLTRLETHAFVKLRNNPRRPSVDIEEILRTTKGWVAGVALLLSTDLGEASTARFDALTAGSLFDYFASEVFDRFPPATKDILLATSLLPRVPASVAKVLASATLADDVLASLAHDGYFTTRFGTDEPVYEYHPLFRAFLCERARRTLSTAQCNDIRSTAAPLLAQAGDTEAAVEVLREAGEWPALVRLIIDTAPKLVTSGRWQTLEARIALLPKEHQDAEPWLLYWRAQAHWQRQIKVARDYNERAFELFCQKGDAVGAYRAWATSTMSYVYAWDDFRPLDRWILALDELRRRWPQAPDADTEAAVVGGICSALLYRQPHNVETQAWFEKADAIVHSNADIQLRRAVGFVLVQFESWRPDFAKAKTLIDALAPAIDGETDPAVALQWCAANSMVQAFAGHTEVSEQLVDKGLELVRQFSLPAWVPMLQMGAACACLGRDNMPQARRVLSALREANGTRPSANQACYEEIATVVALRMGDHSEAMRHAQRCVDLSVRCGSPWWQGRAEAGLIVVELDMGTKRAIDLQGCEQPSNHPHFWRFEAISVGIESAVVALHKGDDDLAASFLDRAFTIAHNGSVRLHASISHHELAELCALALERGITPDYARTLIDTYGLVAPKRAGVHWPWRARLCALGAFAIEIDGEQKMLSRRATSKPLELLHVLMAHAPHEIVEDRVADMLWPNADGDTAQHALETTLYRLRRLLGHPELIVQRQHMLSLNRTQCWVDIAELKRYHGRMKRLVAEASLRPKAIARVAQRALHLYGGPFLLGERDTPWTVRYRERLRRMALHVVDTGIQTLLRLGCAADAEEIRCKLTQAPGRRHMMGRRCDDRYTSSHADPNLS